MRKGDTNYTNLHESGSGRGPVEVLVQEFERSDAVDSMRAVKVFDGGVVGDLE